MKVLVCKDKVNEKINDIEKCISGLRDEIMNFKKVSQFDKSEWSGSAANTYRKSVNVVFQGQLNSFVNSVNTLVNDLKTIMQSYKEIDRLVEVNKDGE